jgi:hypothetical protein
MNNFALFHYIIEAVLILSMYWKAYKEKKKSLKNEEWKSHWVLKDNSVKTLHVWCFWQDVIKGATAILARGPAHLLAG